MLQIDPSELRITTTEELRALRQRLYHSPFAIIQQKQESRETEFDRALHKQFQVLFENSITKRERTIKLLQCEVCKRHGVKLDDLINKKRVPKYVKARDELMYLWASECKFMTLDDISFRLNFRDHSAAFNGIKRHARHNNLVMPKRPRSTKNANSSRKMA